MFLKGPNIIKKLRQRSQCFYCTVKNRHNLVPMIHQEMPVTHRKLASRTVSINRTVKESVRVVWLTSEYSLCSWGNLHSPLSDLHSNKQFPERKLDVWGHS